MIIKDIAHERRRTRDLLLEYDISIMPPHPRSAGLKMIYPWENINNSVLKQQIYDIALDNGYVGTVDDFWDKFSSSVLVHGTLDTFPVPGNEYSLYFDDDTSVLYYFKSANGALNEKLIARIGAAIVGTSVVVGEDIVTYLYIPVRALPIEDLIYDSGDASDYIG